MISRVRENSEVVIKFTQTDCSLGWPSCAMLRQDAIATHEINSAVLLIALGTSCER